MTDDQNQALLRAFAAARAQSSASLDDPPFVATVSAGIRRRRQWRLRMRLLTLLVLLVLAAVLAPYAAEIGSWAAATGLWFADTVAGPANSAVDALTIGGVTVVSLGFAALVALWAMRRT